MKSLVIKKDYSDVEVRDFFILHMNTGQASIHSELVSAIQNAKRMICIQMEKGFSNEIVSDLISTKANIYAIIPEIEENKISTLKDKIIIREVKNLHGNMLIIDKTLCFIFNDKFEGFSIKSKETKYIQELFTKWFWTDSKFEYINHKSSTDESKFDILPIFGDEGFVVGTNLEKESNLSKILNSANEIKTTGSYNNIKNKKSVTIKNLSNISNSQNLDGDIYYAPDLPFSFIISNEQCYYINVDPNQFNTLPEKDTDKIYAIKTEYSKIGTVYKFIKKMNRRDLVDKKLKNIDGSDFSVIQNESLNKEIEIDLNTYKLYKNMNQDNLEQRLNTKYPKLISTDTRVLFTDYIINVKITKHKSNTKIPLYKEYEKLPQILKNKLVDIKKMTNDDILIKKCDEEISKLPNNYNDSNSYNLKVKDVNDLILSYNGSIDKKIDDDLIEITKKTHKIPQKIELVKPIDLDYLPKYGILYQNEKSFEYVLTKESYLEDAIKESESKGFTEITYHLE